MVSTYTPYQKNYMRTRYQNDPEFRRRMIKHLQNYKLRYPIRAWANAVIQGHKRRKFPLKVTRQQLEELGNKTPYCPWCNRTLKYGPQKGKKRWHNDSASVDIIDRSKTPTIDNIRILCVQCNSAKSTMTIPEFVEWIERVYVNAIGLRG